MITKLLSEREWLSPCCGKGLSETDYVDIYVCEWCDALWKMTNIYDPNAPEKEEPNARKN